MSGLLNRLSEAVAGRAVPVPLPEWCHPKVDEVEELASMRDRDASSSWAGFMHYTDASGNQTARRIICRRIEGYGRAETITAFCCERKATRSFRIDRILELISLDTGEFLNPAQHFEQLRLHGALAIVDKSLNDFAKAMVFMARCDGTFHPLEAESVDEAIERYIIRFGGDDRLFEQAQRNAGRIAPDGEDFVNSLERLGHHPEARQLGRLMSDCLSNITLADGKLHSSEVEWATLASDVLRQMAEPPAA
jgi:hypothetical protein